MNNTNHVTDLLKASLKVVSDLSSNIVSGALLTNALFVKKAHD